MEKSSKSHKYRDMQREFTLAVAEKKAAFFRTEIQKSIEQFRNVYSRVYWQHAHNRTVFSVKGKV
jgi:hypothetical protein